MRFKFWIQEFELLRFWVRWDGVPFSPPTSFGISTKTSSSKTKPDKERARWPWCSHHHGLMASWLMSVIFLLDTKPVWWRTPNRFKGAHQTGLVSIMIKLVWSRMMHQTGLVAWLRRAPRAARPPPKLVWCLLNWFSADTKPVWEAPNQFEEGLNIFWISL